MKVSPSNLNLIKKALSLSVTNVYRNKFLSIATIFVIGIIIFIFNIILAINFIANDSINNISKKIGLIFYMKESTTIEQAKQVMQDLRTLQEVKEVTYISKDQALKDITTAYPEISKAFDKYNLGNPLPASINVVTSLPQYHLQITEFLNQDKYRSLLSNSKTSTSEESEAIMASVSKNLIKLSSFTHQVIFWLIIVFVIGGTLITLNALQITIYTRKKEIEVMKLTGASYWFIRLPFIMEGAIYGIMSIILSCLMFVFLSKNIQIENLDISNFSNINISALLLVELIVTMILTIGSSLIAVHEHLSKRSLS